MKSWGERAFSDNPRKLQAGNGTSAAVIKVSGYNVRSYN
jgi:hypothetical protein